MFRMSMLTFIACSMVVRSSFGFAAPRIVRRSFTRTATTRMSADAATEAGHVYFVATPLGNLKDITIRAKDILTNADYVCAEDTRHTINLLRHLQIPHKQLISHHEHNHETSIPYIVSLAKAGKSIAVVSDAGTPGISDPGTELAAALAAEDVIIHPIPGPSAVAAALSISGFPCTPFTFFGFLPVKGTARKNVLEQIAATKHTVVFYEAPHRIQRTLSDILSQPAPDTGSASLTASLRTGKKGVYMNNRRCVSCRELTKVHEQISRGSIQQILQGLQREDGDHSASDSSNNEPRDDGRDAAGDISNNISQIRNKGEFTIVLGPVSSKDSLSSDHDSTSNADGASDRTSESNSIDAGLGQMLLKLKADGLRRSEAVKLCADMYKLSRSVVYAKALSIPDW